ncbi:MAG: carbohydrate porin [Singulisphaera sp.]
MARQAAIRRRTARLWHGLRAALLVGLLVALQTSCPARAQELPPGSDVTWYNSDPRLTGEWWGARPTLAESGITLNADNISFFFGNATGGSSQQLLGSGHGDYVLNFDGQKLGVADGTYLKIRAEHRYGQTVVNNVGCFISPTLLSDLPVFNSNQLYLTDVLISRMIGESFEVYAGKMDTLDGDKNAIAHARGKTQFSNMAFVFNPIVGATVPYSTLGAGMAYLRDGEAIAAVTILNSTDTTGTSGFSQLFNDGLLLSAFVRLPTELLGLPGHQFLGGTWNSQHYTNLREAYVEYPNLTIPTTRGSWALFWNFDQYLVVDERNPARGWGPFGRAGIADKTTSPIAWFLSFGFGGSSPFASRPDDEFGIGWYHAATSSYIGPLLAAQYGPIGNGEGVECYYNYHLTPAVRLTPDVQIVVPALRSFDTALILGLRAQLVF